jgi:steroid delta-isomerase-like uncharacterized protein
MGFLPTLAQDFKTNLILTVMQNVKDLTRQIHAHFSANEFEPILHLAHPDIVVHAHAFGMTLHGKEGFSGFLQSFKGAFPDVAITHRNILSEGDQVAVEFTAQGTHTGPLQTPAGAIPATGKPVTFVVTEVLRWENGLLKSLSNYQDSSAILRQIGVI